MGTNSTEAAAVRATGEVAKRNLASIRPSFIVKDLQTSITYYREWASPVLVDGLFTQPETAVRTPLG